MTLTQAIDNKRAELIAGFALFLSHAENFTYDEINAVFQEPWKWNTEFTEWYETRGE